jgi:transmembrane sensor
MKTRNTILEFPNKERVHEEAAAWIVRISNGKLSSDEIGELKAWCKQSPGHLKILLDTARVWDQMDVMAGLSELLRLDPVPEKRHTRLKFVVPAIAASLACLGIVLLFGLLQSDRMREQQQVADNPEYYETAIGDTEVIHLADGSVVTINTGTKISVDILSGSRHIDLLTGEAYFEVARIEGSPFVVTVGNTRIEAVGTAFIVQKSLDEVEVTVAQGLVQVKQVDPRAPQTADTGLPPVLLKAGQMMHLGGPDKREVIKIETEKIARKLLWQQYMLAFDGDTLDQVIDEFSRYVNFRIEIADAETASIKVGGYFRSDDLAGLLTSLEDNFAISVEQTAPDAFKLAKK